MKAYDFHKFMKLNENIAPPEEVGDVPEGPEVKDPEWDRLVQALDIDALRTHHRRPPRSRHRAAEVLNLVQKLRPNAFDSVMAYFEKHGLEAWDIQNAMKMQSTPLGGKGMFFGK